MPLIKLHKDPLAHKPIAYEVGCVNLLDWLQDNAPHVAGWEFVTVCKNGVVIGNSAKTDLNDACDFFLSDNDTIEIISTPQGLELSIGAIFLVSAAAAAITFAFLPKPEIPNDAGVNKSSPNNELNSATNEFRKNQADADIAGRIIAFPDFQQPSYYEYVNNRRVFTEIFCVGVGYYDIEDVRSSETSLDDIAGSSYTVYPPSSSIPTQLIVRSSNEVDNFEPTVPDDPDRELSLNGATVTAPNTISGINVTGINLQDGDKIYIDIAWNAGSTNDTRVGEFEVENVGPASFDIVGQTLNSSQNIGDVTGFMQSLSNEAAGEWFILPGGDADAVWFQVIAPQGLMDENMGGLAVTFDLEIQEVDGSGNPVGAITTQGASISGRTRSPVKETFKVSTPTPYKPRARIIRTSESVPQGGLDRINIEAIQAATEYTPSSDNITSVLVERATNENAQGQSRSKINVIGTRRLELFNPANGTFATGVYTATRSFAQYVMYLLVKLGNVPLNEIDYESLFNIESSLSDPQLGYFDFSFDDIDVAIGQRVESACNAARVKVYDALGRWNFVRDEAQPVSVQFFNRRNIHGDIELRRGYYVDNDYDSVNLKYVDPTTNDEAFIERRINPTTGAIESGIGNRVQNITLAGCRNATQATNRADLEIRRIKYVKWSGNMRAGSEALTVGPMNRISIADINDTQIFDGEILADEGGGLYRTTEKFVPEIGVSYVVFINDSEGAVGTAVTCNPHPSTEFGFSASGLGAVVSANGYEIQVGTRYMIASEDDVERAQFLVTKRGRPDEQFTTRLEFSQYDARVYEMD